MANDLSVLIPTLIASLTAVSREGLGFIEAVDQDFSDMGASVGQEIQLPSVDGVTLSDVTPSNVSPTFVDSTPTQEIHAIRKSRHALFGWTGEDAKKLAEKGADFRSRKIEEAFRQLTNEIETDVGIYGALGAGSAYGTAGTDPFGSSLADLVATEKRMFDNGTIGERHIVMDSSAWSNLGNLTNLQKVNEAGSDITLRNMQFPQLAGFRLHRSSQVARPAIGTGTTFLVNNGGGYAIGAVSIAVDGDAGTILAGDVLTFAGHTYKYVVKTGTTGAGTIVLAVGLKAAVADNAAVTIVAISRKNLAFTRGSIVLSTRPPAVPEGGDMADDSVLITDPFSQLTFQVNLYRQFKQATYEVAIAWGATARKRVDIVDVLGL